MTKTATVAEAMRALSETFSISKPEPVDVRIVTQKLTPNEAARFVLTLLLSWPLRALVVWAFLAIFIPALGVTYLAVLFGLWAVAVVMPPKPDMLAKAILADRKQ